MASKLKLKPNATFKYSVFIPVAGSDSEPVLFEFRSKTHDEYSKLLKDVAERHGKPMDDSEELKNSVDTVMDFTVGWDLPEAFTRENLTELLQNYIGSGRVIFRAYIDELGKARLGN